MNTIPTKINRYNVYNKGNRLLGVGEEMTLPDFEPSSETVTGAGILGEIDDPTVGYFSNQELEIPFRLLDKETADMMDMTKAVQLEIRGAQQTTNTEGDTTTTTGDGTSVEVRCTVPTDQTVFPGLKATIGIDAGSVTGALLAPVSAVEGSFTAGSVWVLSDPSDPKTAVKTAVTLGITDGTNIQITEGVKEGDTILQYVPGKDITRTGKPNTCEPDYSVCYDENGEEIR